MSSFVFLKGKLTFTKQSNLGNTVVRVFVLQIGTPEGSENNLTGKIFKNTVSAGNREGSIKKMTAQT